MSTPITVDEQSIQCVLCKQLPTNAIETSCCHQLLCDSCSRALPDSPDSGSRVCPMCRHEPLQTSTSVALRRLIDQFRVPCSYCNERVGHGDLDIHALHCTKRPRKCLFGQIRAGPGIRGTGPGLAEAAPAGALSDRACGFLANDIASGVAHWSEAHGSHFWDLYEPFSRIATNGDISASCTNCPRLRSQNTERDQKISDLANQLITLQDQMRQIELEKLEYLWLYANKMQYEPGSTACDWSFSRELSDTNQYRFDNENRRLSRSGHSAYNQTVWASSKFAPPPPLSSTSTEDVTGSDFRSGSQSNPCTAKDRFSVRVLRNPSHWDIAIGAAIEGTEFDQSPQDSMTSWQLWSGGWRFAAGQLVDESFGYRNGRTFIAEGSVLSVITDFARRTICYELNGIRIAEDDTNLDAEEFAKLRPFVHIAEQGDEVEIV